MRFNFLKAVGLACIFLSGCGGGGGGGLSSAPSSIPIHTTGTFSASAVRLITTGNIYGNEVVSARFTDEKTLEITYASYTYQAADGLNVRPSSVTRYQLTAGVWTPILTEPIIPPLPNVESVLQSHKGSTQNGYALGGLAQGSFSNTIATIGHEDELLEIAQCFSPQGPGIQPLWAVAATPGATRICVVGKLLAGKIPIASLVTRGGPDSPVATTPDPTPAFESYIAILEK